MKDKLSNLVQFNARSLACDSVEKAVSTWLPLLEAVSSLKGVSEVQLVSSLLFNGLNEEWEFEHVEITPEKKQKSGTLDKLNDDCIGHCLSFLHFEDVATNVECTCRRLFHVSRSMKRPFRIENFNDCFQNEDCQHFPFRLAPRFYALQMDVTKWPLRYDSSWLSQEMVAHFCDCLEQLSFDDSVTEVLELTFDRLKQIQCDDVDSSILVPFATRNPTVDTCVLKYSDENALTRELYANLREMRNLRKLTLDVYDFDEREFGARPPGFGAPLELSHITEVTLKKPTRLCFVRPLLHSKLKRLSVCLSQRHNVDNGRVQPLALGSLQQLTVCGGQSLLGEDDYNALEGVLFFKLRTNGSAMQKLSVTSVTLECLIPSLLLCPRGEISVVVSDYVSPERVPQRMQTFEMLRTIVEASHGSMFAPTKLHVSFKRPFYDEAAGFFLTVMRLLATIIPITAVTVSYKRHLALERLGPGFGEAMRSLRAVSNVELEDRTEIRNL